MATGTFECPICGFDKPHTHEARVVEWHRTGNRISPPGSGIVDADGNDVAFEWGPLNPEQRKTLRMAAESQYRYSVLKAEFDADPRAYVNRYGTINSPESSFLVQWLLERIDRLEGQR